MAQRATEFYTPEEYLAREEAAEYKSEYDNGQIVALAGASNDHNRITVNLTAALDNALENKPCRVYATDMRLQVNERQYTYPDLMVICGKPQFVQGRNDTITNPLLIVEVLSPSARNYDGIKKFATYKRIPSLHEYLLVDSEELHAERLTQVENSDRWEIEMYDDLDAIVSLESIQCELPLRRIYRQVEFAEQEQKDMV